MFYDEEEEGGTPLAQQTPQAPAKPGFLRGFGDAVKRDERDRFKRFGQRFDQNSEQLPIDTKPQKYGRDRKGGLAKLIGML